MSRSVTATTEIKINMSTRDDINISKGREATQTPNLPLPGNKRSILIIITKPWLSRFLDQRLYVKLIDLGYKEV